MPLTKGEATDGAIAVLKSVFAGAFSRAMRFVEAPLPRATRAG
jgi:hypothetical protein